VSSWLALDGGWSEPAEAEHATLDLLGSMGVDPGTTTACTHLVAAGTAAAHVAATVEIPTVPAGGLPSVPAGTAVATLIGEGVQDGAGPAPLLAFAREALAAHRRGLGGRAFQFPGQAGVAGGLTVREIGRRTAIAAVVDLAGRVLPEADVVQTFGFVRPTYSAGRLALMVGPYADGQHVPFELEHPTRCCAFH